MTRTKLVLLLLLAAAGSAWAVRDAVEPLAGTNGVMYYCLEAEDFACSDGGWKETWQGYFAASPNSWTRNKLEAEADDAPAEARRILSVRQAGPYKLFARYESTYGFGNAFGVRVVQKGRTVFEKRYGYREDRAHFPFGRGCTRMGEWFWHNTELVYTLGDVVELAEGEAEVVLFKDRNEYPPARRVLDHLFLTGDLSLGYGAGETVFHSRGDKVDTHSPILSKFRKPFWVRLSMTRRQESPVKVGFRNGWMVNGYWMGPMAAQHPVAAEGGGVTWSNIPGGSYWFIHGAKPTLREPFESPWLRVDAYTVEVPTFAVLRTQAVDGLRFQIADGEPCGKHLVWDAAVPADAEPYEVIVPIGHGFYENENILARGKPVLYRELQAGQAKAVRDFKVPGRPPRLFAACGMPEPRHSGLDLHQALGLNAAFANAPELIYAPEAARTLGTFTNWCYPNSHPSWLGGTNPPPDEALAASLREARAKDPLGYLPANYKMIEESGPKGLDDLRKDPKHREAFRAFARARGVDPRRLLAQEAVAGLAGKAVTDDDLWGLVELGTGSDGEANARPELYYLSRLYRGWQFAENFRRLRENLESVFPQDRMNPGSIFISDGYTVGLARGVDVFALFRQKGMSSYDSENSWGRDAAAYIGPQSMSYEGAIARALTKYEPFPRGTRTTYMLVSGVNGYGVNPEYIPLQGLAGFAQGLDMFKYYQMGRDCSTAIFHLSALKGIKYINYTIGSVEDDLLGAGGKVVPAQVAVGWSVSTDIWDLTLRPRLGAESTAMVNNIYPQERHQLYLLLRHCQVPADILDERDLEDGLLDGYKVYVLAGDHLSRKAADRLIAWVKAGGTVVAAAGGGIWDEYNRENPAMLELFGLEKAPLQKVDIGLRPKLELIHRIPLATAVFPQGEVDYYGYVQNLVPAKTNAAEVLAPRAEGGKPAAVRMKHGRGAAILCGFLPGMAYLKPAIPAWPFGRGGRDELSSFSPTNYPSPIRAIVRDWLTEAGVRAPVTCSEPLVEPTLWKGEDGVYRVCLVNFSLAPIRNLGLVTEGLEYRRVVDVATGKTVSKKPGPFTTDLERFQVLRFEP